jgi:hypothetical protein
MGLDALRRLYLALWPIRLDTFLGGALFPAVLIAACLGGFWPGLLATVVSTFAATYFLVKPPGFRAIHGGRLAAFSIA